jgi:Peptidase family M28
MANSDRGWLGWTLLVLAAAISWFAIEQQKPPPAKSTDAPPLEFSAGRAMAIIRTIAQAPHQTGTPENERVRGVLMKALSDSGIAAEIQMPRDKNSPLRNVVARIKGQGPTGKKGLLLCAHYDTPQYSPGAGDDASGVAVVLETLRAIKSGPALDRNVIALLADGEERGLQGSKLFVDEHPWTAEVGVVLNFDARGSSGPSFMFETSAGNGWLIRQFALASPRPLATSVSMDVYPILGNDSDLTSFKRAGVAGLNFAFIGSYANYHTLNDTVENLDADSVQHDGDNALALTRHLGVLDLDNPTSEDVIYASILGRMVLYYPKKWSAPVAHSVAVIFVIVVVLGLWSRRLTISEIGIGVLAAPIVVLASIFTVQLFWMVLRDILLNLHLFGAADDVLILSICSMIAAVVTLTIFRRLARGRSLDGVALGALTTLLVLTLVTARWLPNSSFVFACPTLFALIGLAGAILARPGSASGQIWIMLAAVPTLVLLPPVIRNMIDGLGLRLAGLVMIPVVLFLVAILPVLAPLFADVSRRIASEESRVSS